MNQEARTEPLTVSAYDPTGTRSGTAELPGGVSDAAASRSALHEVVVYYQASRRRGTSDTKTRAEVSGGGRKPWRQKGTGRARAGSIRSPLWRHGGTIFGPHPRSYGYALPRGKVRLALAQAMAAKAVEGKVIVLEGIPVKEGRTREMAGFLRKVEAGPRPLLVMGKPDPMVERASRNLSDVVLRDADAVTVLDVVAADRILVSRDALPRLEQRCAHD